MLRHFMSILAGWVVGASLSTVGAYILCPSQDEGANLPTFGEVWQQDKLGQGPHLWQHIKRGPHFGQWVFMALVNGGGCGAVVGAVLTVGKHIGEEIRRMRETPMM